MKLCSLVFVVYLLLSHGASAAGTPLVLLSSDQAQYLVGSSATLSAAVIHNPEDAQFELYLESYVDGSPVNISAVGASSWEAKTTAFDYAGTYNWEVNVYLQNKEEAAALNAGISAYAKQVGIDRKRLQTEVDPSVRAALEAEIAKDEALIADAKQRLIDQRTFLEVDNLSLTVTNN